MKATAKTTVVDVAVETKNHPLAVPHHQHPSYPGGSIRHHHSQHPHHYQQRPTFAHIPPHLTANTTQRIYSTAHNQQPQHQLNRLQPTVLPPLHGHHQQNQRQLPSADDDNDCENGRIEHPLQPSLRHHHVPKQLCERQQHQPTRSHSPPSPRECRRPKDDGQRPHSHHSPPSLLSPSPPSHRQTLRTRRTHLIDALVDDDVEHIPNQIPVTFIPCQHPHTQHNQREQPPPTTEAPSADYVDHRRHQHMSEGIVTRELTSPRCPSRGSSASGRSPSADSNYSSHNSTGALPTNPNTNSPLGMGGATPMQHEANANATDSLLAPNAQNAAMAAYLNAAAVAAQQGRLLGLGVNHLQSIAALSANTVGAIGIGHSLSPHGSNNVHLRHHQHHLQQHHQTQQHMMPPLSSPMGSESSVLDFSTKRKSLSDFGEDRPLSSDACDGDGSSGGGGPCDLRSADGSASDDIVNLSQGPDNSCPLDLTVTRKRFNSSTPPHQQQARKVARAQEYKASIASSSAAVASAVPTPSLSNTSPWTTPMTPYFAEAVAAASNMSPNMNKSLDWTNTTHVKTTNIGSKSHHSLLQLQHQQQNTSQSHSTAQQQSPVQQHPMNDATKALEKMSELSRLGGNDVGRQSGISASTSGSGGRHSAWQSHWLNKGADSVKDVFKCVWCKLSFPTLESLTTHMKETQHIGNHGGNHATGSGASISSSSSATANHHHSHHHQHQTQQQHQQQQQQHHQQSNISQQTHQQQLQQHNQQHTNKANAAAAAAQSKAELNLLIKETMPLPRKLVRGQDVWLGKGAEQTRQILKCMWCGQSFRTLNDMTTHMQQTQHYTNIISQEQIISWKSSDEKNPPVPAIATSAGSNSGGAGAASSGQLGAMDRTTNSSGSSCIVGGNNAGIGGGIGGGSSSATSATVASTASSTVSAVLTCKVCDMAFTSLKDLSNHIVKNSHYKEHIMRSISDGAGSGRRRQTKEKRKKSLPVRKLLEMERAQQDGKNGDVSTTAIGGAGGGGIGLGPSAIKQMRDVGRITCDKCGEKIDAFPAVTLVEHIKKCVGGDVNTTQRSTQISVKNTSSLLNSVILPDSHGHLSMLSSGMSNSRDGRLGDKCGTPNSRLLSPHAIITSPGSNKDGTDANSSSTESNSGPSVLNALEKLIEKSFDTRSRHGAAGSGSNANNAFATQQSSPLGSSILKRLGIDESVDYTKPLIDQQTMHFLRNYSQHQHQQLQQQSHHQHSSAAVVGRRERSGSESSSVSDRGSSRLNSLTPEQKLSSPLDLHQQQQQQLHSQFQQHLQHQLSLPDQAPPTQQRFSAATDSEDVDMGGISSPIKRERLEVFGDVMASAICESNPIASSSSSTSSSPKTSPSATICVKKENDDNDDNDGGDDDDDDDSVNDEDDDVPNHTSKRVVNDSKSGISTKGNDDSITMASDQNNKNVSGINQHLTDGYSQLSDSTDAHSIRKATTPICTSSAGGRSVTPNNTSSPFKCDNDRDGVSMPRSLRHDASVLATYESAVASSNNGSGNQGSLGALSSMFDSLTGNSTSSVGGGLGANGSSGIAGKDAGCLNVSRKGGFHPLAALQKLCDKAETKPQIQQRRGSTGCSASLLTASAASVAAAALAAASGTSSTSTLAETLTSGISSSDGTSNADTALMAFSWACNNAMMQMGSTDTTTTTNIKCKLCDSSYSSTASYRQHLIRVHFVDESSIGTEPANNDSTSGQQSSARQLGSPQQPSPASTTSPTSDKNTGIDLSGGQRLSPQPPQTPPQQHQMKTETPPDNVSASPTAVATSSSAIAASPASVFDESPHSKFLKYTELAKQLSSKYV